MRIRNRKRKDEERERCMHKGRQFKTERTKSDQKEIKHIHMCVSTKTEPIVAWNMITD